MARSRGGPWLTSFLPAIQPHADRVISPAGSKGIAAAINMRRAESPGAIVRLGENRQLLVDAIGRYAKARLESIAAAGQHVVSAGADLLHEMARLPVSGELKSDMAAVEDAWRTMSLVQPIRDDAVVAIPRLRQPLRDDPGNPDLREALFELESR